LSSTSSFADEGMWTPLQLKQKEAALKARGLKIPVEEIFSNDSISLKDAIVQFGGGCTGEVVSDQGLVLTNHHCGFSQIQSLSTVAHDYLKNGYWAKNKSDELPCPGLTVTFVVKIENVTDRILAELKDTMSEDTREKKVTELSRKIEKAAENKMNGGKDTIHQSAMKQYQARVRPFYYGNEYYLFITEVFRDIRLVGAPPVSIGKFGGETDNWVWPRHNGDFSMFRIYADSANHPAEYSANNVPYKPKKFLTISMKGVKENDFAMVYGFPGRTQEYISSSAVNMIQHVDDPSRVRVRDARLKIWHEAMSENDTVRLQYASKYSSIANYYKKWKGEVNGLERVDAIGRKKEYEEKFSLWLQENNIPQYKDVLADLESAYTQLMPLSRLYDYYTEAVLGTELIAYTNAAIRPLADLAKKDSVSNDSVKAAANRIFKAITSSFKNYRPAIDEKVLVAMLKLYHDSIPKDFQPDVYQTINNKFKGDYEKYASFVFSKTIFADSTKLKSFLSEFSKKSLKKILNDPAYQLTVSFTDMMKGKVSEQYLALNKRVTELQRKYMKAQMEMRSSSSSGSSSKQPAPTATATATATDLYPDANLTLRFAYGQIKGYEPREGVHYDFQTTLDGVMEKYIPNDAEFNVPDKLQELYRNKDYGAYSIAGKVPVCFIGNAHTTGGNSGSPMLNAKGELTGLNFDTVWEGTMSDINYEAAYSRNICVDIRYVLFIIDKYAGAENLINEMRVN